MKPFFRPLLPLSFAFLLSISMPAMAQGDKAVLQLKTVVIDAGHGGKDPGCVSRDGKTYEKTIVLDIAKRLRTKILSNYPDVDVVMTRYDDRFVELEKRAVTANKSDANLFISIHVNSVEKGTSANGFSIHVLGQSQKKGNDLYSKNLELVKRENAVIMLEDDYQAKYQGFDPNDPQSSIIFSLMQNAYLNASLGFAEDVADAMKLGPIMNNRGVSQDPFWVLWRTTMPAVLIEVGFMSNPDDLKVLRSQEGRDAIATNICNALWAFKTRYEFNSAPEQQPKAKETAPAKDKKEAKEEKKVVKEEEKKVVKEEEKPVVVKQEDKKVVKEEEKPVVKQEEKKVVKEEEKPAVKEEAKVLYGVQVLATGKKMSPTNSYFQGLEPIEVRVGNIYKYIVVSNSSLEEVRKEFPKIRSIFKDSFMVKIENGSTAPVR